MAKVINSVVLSSSVTITQCTDGYWLWDDTRKMNLAMKAESSEAALMEALEYYQRRLTEVESNYNSLKAKVDHFVGQFEDDNDSHYCDRCGSYS